MNRNELKVAIWNANGLAQHQAEVRHFLKDKSLDLFLISETHFCSKSFLTIPEYTVVTTNHPNGKARGGSAILVHKNVQFVETESFQEEHIQATTIQINDGAGEILISSVYSPPRHNISAEQYEKFLQTLGSRYKVDGDFNAKHTAWGSRLTNTKGKNLLKAIKRNNGKYISTGEPTYWPTDTKKKPDLIDFFITKNINVACLSTKSCLELSSDHSPVILNYTSEIVCNTECQSRLLYNKKTNWDAFRENLGMNISANIPLKCEKELDGAIACLNDEILQALNISTPITTIKEASYSTPKQIQLKIKEKRKIRKRWQCTRCPADKKQLNLVNKELKSLLIETENARMNSYLKSLTPTSSTNYSLWKATKSSNKVIQHKAPLKKEDDTWAKTDLERATTLANFYETNFTNNLNGNKTLPKDFAVYNDQKITPFKTNEISYCIKHRTKAKKSPGYDLITEKILKELPLCALTYIRNLFNSVLRLNYFPAVWKVALIVPILKPGKDPSAPASFRPISLLPLLSKVFEKLFLDRLEKIIAQRNLIPGHQFGFRREHSTVQQIHRVVTKITEDLEKKKYCASVFLDVSKAFDKVWHDGLLHKLRKMLPPSYLTIIKSYLIGRLFYVKCSDDCSTLRPIQAGVPQGSVLGPILYVLFTSDIPIPRQSHSQIATFADDTAILASDCCLKAATIKLQNLVNEIIGWFNRWNMHINEEKTVQVTYTSKSNLTHYPININNKQVQISNHAKYLGMHIDSKLTWKQHLNYKRTQIKLKMNQLHWMMGKHSKLTLNNKILLYKTIIKPIWLYGIQLWGTTKKSNICIIQRQQNKILRQITGASWYITNADLHHDLEVPLVNEEIVKVSAKHI